MLDEQSHRAPTSDLAFSLSDAAPSQPQGGTAALALAFAVFALSYFVAVGSAAPTAPSTRPAAPEAADAVEVRRVLVLGDSHSAGTFGQALDLLLRSHPGTDVVTVGNCGVSPDAYLEMKSAECGSLLIDEDADQVEYRRRAPVIPQLPALLEAHDPDLAVVALGANQIHTAFTRPDEAREDIRRFAAHLEARGTKCVWIGPPFGSPQKKPVAKMNHLYDVLADALPASCTLVDSRPGAMPFLDYPELAKKAGKRGDGRHFDSLGLVGKAAARKWALSVFEVVRPMLAPAPTPMVPRDGVRLASVD